MEEMGFFVTRMEEGLVAKKTKTPYKRLWYKLDQDFIHKLFYSE
jgi:hypothetical protein